MKKIIGLTLFGLVMIVEVIAAIIAYVLSFIYLVCVEIIGTRQFRLRFAVLNKFIVEQIKGIVHSYKEIIERV